MSELKVQEKEVVAPGEVLATGMDYIPGKGAYRLGDEIIANEVGLVQLSGRSIKLIPLSGKYIPKKDDTIICKVIDIIMSGWRVDTNSAYSGIIGLRDGSTDFIARGADLSRYHAIDDIIVAKIMNVSSQMLVDLSAVGPGLRKLRGGVLLEVGCKKVPRIIGKQGSMVTLIKNATGCQITVGQNGRVWIKGEPIAQAIAISAVKKIEKEAHRVGLTDTMKIWLEEQTKDLKLDTFDPESSNKKENKNNKGEDIFPGDEE